MHNMHLLVLQAQLSLDSVEPQTVDELVTKQTEVCVSHMSVHWL